MAKADYLSIAKALTYSNTKHSICQFLDDFRWVDNKLSLIKDEPAADGERKTLCLAASIVHKLANDNGIEPPEWVYKPEYIFPHPVYTFNTQNKEYQKVLRETTPEEFAQRNIYYGANVIARI